MEGKQRRARHSPEGGKRDCLNIAGRLQFSLQMFEILFLPAQQSSVGFEQRQWESREEHLSL